MSWYCRASPQVLVSASALQVARGASGWAPRARPGEPGTYLS